MRFYHVLACALAFCLPPGQAHAVEYIYPAAIKSQVVVDITGSPYFADNTGTVDVTSIIQQAIDEHKWNTSVSGGRVLYFPNGTYLVSDMIIGTDLDNAEGQGEIILRGQSRDGVVIKLQDNCDGTGGTGDFSDPANTLPILSYFEGNGTNNAFGNYLENLTIDIGSGNPGAIGVAFFCNNHGAVRNVLFRTSDPTGAGAVGLTLARDDDTLNGVGRIKDVEVQGFDVGISFDHSAQGHPWALEDIILSDQKVAGIVNQNHPLALRKITSTNTVPAIVQKGPAGHTSILDSTFIGGNVGNAAIERQSGWLFVRDCTQSGYRAIIDNDGVDITADLSNDEFFSGTVLKQWTSTPSRSLDLEIVDTPEVPWIANATEWEVVDSSTQGDDTIVVQAAMNSGKQVIAFGAGLYNLSNTITVGPNVRRIIGNFSRIHVNSSAQSLDIPIFRVAGSNHPNVIFEGFTSNLHGLSTNYFMVEHDSNADIILKDIGWEGALFRNTANATGRLFIDNVWAQQSIHINDQKPIDALRLTNGMVMYARQLNLEGMFPHINNVGGTAWVFGAKFGEQRGSVRTSNGGSTELIAALQNVSSGTTPTIDTPPVLLEIENANVSAILIEKGRPVVGWGTHEELVVETRNTETRKLLRSDGIAPIRVNENGSVLPMVVAYQLGANIAASQAIVGEGDGILNAAFTVSRDSSDTSSAQTLYYTVSGAATAGTDYDFLTGQATIPAGQLETTIAVSLIDDGVSEPNELLTVTLTAHPAYALGSVQTASVTIRDNDTIVPETLEITQASGTAQQFSVAVINPHPESETITLDVPQGDYAFKDSRLSPAVDFVWMDISTTGTETISNYPESYLRDDGFATLPLGFTFPWGGSSLTEVTVSANGFLTAAPPPLTSGYWVNGLLPGFNLEGIMAALWDDLKPGSPNGTITYQHFSEAELQATHPEAWAEYGTEVFVVQWNDVRHYNNPETVTFQVVLQPNGNLNYVYWNLDGADAVYTYTVGYQFGTGSASTGESISRDSVINPNYLASLTRLLIQPESDWVTADQLSFSIPASGQETFNLTVDTTGISTGSYYAEITVRSDNPAQGDIIIPINLTVSNLPAAPGDLSVEILSNTSAQISWTDNANNETAYVVERSLGPVGPWSVIGGTLPANSTAYVDNDVDSTVEYFYRVRATNANGDSPDITPVSSFLPPQANGVSIIGTLEVAEVLTGSYTYSDPNGDPEGLTQFRWLRADSPGAELSLIPGATESTYTLTTADDGRYIAVEVIPISVNAPTAGNPSVSDRVGPVGGLDSPTAPGNLQATVTSRETISLSWSDTTSLEESFILERSLNGEIWSILETLPANTTSHDNSGLVPSTRYYFRVKARNASGDSPYSNWADTMIPGGDGPHVRENFDYPSGTTLSSGTAGGIGWTPAPTGYYSDSALTTENNMVEVTNHIWTVPGGYTATYLNKAVMNNAYLYRAMDSAYAIDSGSDPVYFSFLFHSDGIVGGSRFGFASADGAGVNDLQVRQISTHQFRLYAGNSSLATTSTNYGNEDVLIIGYIDPGSTSNNMKLKVVRSGEQVSPTEEWDLVTSVNIAAFDPLDRVYYSNNSGTVRFGNLAVGADWDAVTLIPFVGLPSAPSLLTAALYGSDTIDLSWNDNSGNESGFVIERSVNGIHSWATLATHPANTTSYSDTSLDAGDFACYRVFARNVQGDSDPSGIAREQLPMVFADWLDNKGYTGNNRLSDADPDNNGISNLLQYALGIPSGASIFSQLPRIGSLVAGEQSYLTLTFRRNLAASEVIYSVRYSTDLADWNPSIPVWVSNAGDDNHLIERTDNFDGTETLTIRHLQSIENSPRAFLRLQVDLP